MLLLNTMKNNIFPQFDFGEYEVRQCAIYADVVGVNMKFLKKSKRWMKAHWQNKEFPGIFLGCKYSC